MGSRAKKRHFKSYREMQRGGSSSISAVGHDRARNKVNYETMTFSPESQSINNANNRRVRRWQAARIVLHRLIGRSHASRKKPGRPR